MSAENDTGVVYHPVGFDSLGDPCFEQSVSALEVRHAHSSHERCSPLQGYEAIIPLHSFTSF